jgi:hypothetical protein
MEETLYDALWQPVVTQQYDKTNTTTIGNTLSQIITRFDAQGRVSFQSYPQRVYNDATITNTWANPTVTPNTTGGIRTTYDALGRVTKLEQDSELGPLTTTTRYESGFQTWVTNPRLKETRTTHYLVYDEPTTDWPLAIAHPEGVHTSIERDAFGKPTAIARSGGTGVGEIRSYTYNGYQELCRQVEPETGATLMGYDAAGNLAWSASGLPASTACNATGGTAAILARKAARTYDARNRLESLRFPDGRGNQDWSYTPDGLPEQVITSNEPGAPQVINAYNYNRRRMLVGEGVEVDGLHTWSLGYGYNANGHLAVHTYPLGQVVDYAPNALGQPSRAGSYATAASYFPNGALSQFTYGNGIVHTLSQNARGLPVRSQDADGTSAVLDDSYDYDPNGNVAAISDGLPGNRGDRDMGYDGLDRLTSATSAMFGGTASYGYDAIDNLIQVKIGGTAPRDHHYCYDGSNRLTNIKTGSCSGSTVVGLGYDLQGNVLNKNGVGFDFDYGNRLRAALGESYRYDGHGRRVQSLHPSLGDIYSFYGQDGVLRFQRDERANKARSHVYLGGSLVARLEQATIPPSSAPNLTAPASNSTGSYTVSWTSVDEAASYQLQQRKDGGTWSTIHNAAGTSKSVSGLANGSYDYRVRACNTGGCSAFSALKTTVVTLPPSSAPTLTAPATNNTGSYTVSWTSVSHGHPLRVAGADQRRNLGTDPEHLGHQPLDHRQGQWHLWLPGPRLQRGRLQRVLGDQVDRSDPAADRRADPDRAGDQQHRQLHGQLDERGHGHPLRASGASQRWDLGTHPEYVCHQPLDHGQGQRDLWLPGARLQRGRLRSVLGDRVHGGDPPAGQRPDPERAVGQQHRQLHHQLDQHSHGNALRVAGAGQRRDLGNHPEHVCHRPLDHGQGQRHLRLSGPGLQRRRLQRVLGEQVDRSDASPVGYSQPVGPRERQFGQRVHGELDNCQHGDPL